MTSSHKSRIFAAGVTAALVSGIGVVFLGVFALVSTTPIPIPLALALLVLGSTQFATAWGTLRGSRVAWAFGCSLSGTAAVASLFAAAKLRDTFGIPLGGALAPCAFFALIATTYALAHKRF